MMFPKWFFACDFKIVIEIVEDEKIRQRFQCQHKHDDRLLVWNIEFKKKPKK